MCKSELFWGIGGWCVCFFVWGLLTSATRWLPSTSWGPLLLTHGLDADVKLKVPSFFHITCEENRQSMQEFWSQAGIRWGVRHFCLQGRRNRLTGPRYRPAQISQHGHQPPHMHKGNWETVHQIWALPALNRVPFGNADTPQSLFKPLLSLTV